MTPLRPVVIVTGGARRIGRAIAMHLAGDGFDVAVHCHRSESAANETADACRARGARAQSFRADLTDHTSACALIERVMAGMGRLNCLINSAAIMLRTPLHTVTPAQWDQIFALNVRAPFFLSIHAARVMREGGSIVNIGDHLAHESASELVPHAISKGAVETMTRQLARQLAPNVRVNAVVPGAVLPPPDWPDEARERFAERTPLRRLGTPEDVASAVAYLVRAPYVTGHVLVVDGGRSVR
jgi:pteridine reductase